MPLMTKPFAHFEMLASNIKFAIEEVHIEQIKLQTKLEVLNKYRYEIDKALDEERAKVAPPSPPQGERNE